jgi:FkbM family methyltransferase
MMLKALTLPYPRALRDEPAPWLSRLERKIKVKTRKFRRPRVIEISGVTLDVDRRRLPKSVVRALYKETYEDREAALVQHVLTPDDRVLEIGAGIGFISLLCAKRCGAASVLSYEANPDNEALIRRNFELNDLHPQLRNRAIACSNDERELFIEPNILSTGFINRGHGRAKVVQCDAIADVVQEFQPNCLVMDVEGAEIDLLPAAPLEGITKIILETHARIVGDAAIRGLDIYLQSQGFSRYEAAPNDRVWLYLRQ